jgi:hypothetical protein
MSITSLSELENLNVDVEVAPPAEYVDSGNSIIPEGMYDLAITEWDVSTNRETKQPDGKAIILNVRVVGGDLDGRTARNIRVWTTVYERNGAKASQLGDLIRAIDDSVTWTTLAEAGSVIQRAKDQGQTFRAKLKWEAFDAEWFEDQGGKTMDKKSPEAKQLRKQATTAGMANFRQAPDGTFLPEAMGPSGNPLVARLSLDRFVPSGKRR